MNLSIFTIINFQPPWANDQFGRDIPKEELIWRAILPFILAVFGSIFALRSIILLAIMLKTKWFNSDFNCFLVNLFNLAFCIFGALHDLRSFRGIAPQKYLEILIIGILNSCYLSVYATILLINSIDMWLAIQHPFWHHFNVTKRRMIICSFTIIMCVMGVNCLPEIIFPGDAFAYFSEILIAAISTKTMGHQIIGFSWFLIVTLECIITFVFVLLVMIILKKRDQCHEISKGIWRTPSCHSRTMKINFIFATRFNLLWFVLVVIELVFVNYSSVISMLIYLLYLNCIGDGTLYLIIFPRCRKLRADLLNKRSSRSLKILIWVFIWSTKKQIQKFPGEDQAFTLFHK